jgi:hypothetical protein
MTEHRLFTDANARAFTPASEGDRPGIRGNLAEASTGDWCWQPYSRPVTAGQSCTCTLSGAAAGCARHPMNFIN